MRDITFLNVVLDEGEGPHSVPGRFTPGQTPPFVAYMTRRAQGRSFYSF